MQLDVKTLFFFFFHILNLDLSLKAKCFTISVFPHANEEHVSELATFHLHLVRSSVLILISKQISLTRSNYSLLFDEMGIEKPKIKHPEIRFVRALSGGFIILSSYFAFI